MAAIIGAALNRVDGIAKVTGKARYAAEAAKFPDMAEGVLVQSTIGAGRIVDIDTSAAERAPGVVVVMTHKNALPLASKKTNPLQPGEGYPLLQDDRIIFNGQHIAMVVAETFEQATHAATLVKVRYAEEKPAVQLEDALGRLRVPKNFRGGERPPDSKRGDPERAFDAAPVKIDEIYTTPVEHHNPMEPHAAIASWDGDRLTIYHSTQSVMGSRERVATLLGVPVKDVHVISDYVGGGFGSKGSTWPHVTLTAMAARLARRPVRLVLTRRQMFTAHGYRSKTIQRVRLAADRDGKLLATMHDGQAQTSFIGEFVEPVGLATEVMYSCANVGVTHRVAALNVAMPTFMRAPGEASGMFALESAMDELAYRVGIDPLELRLRNYAEKDESKNLPFTSKELRACYAQGATAFGWSRRNPAPGSMRDRKGLLIGWGMASATYPGLRSEAGATVRVERDGTVVVQSATQDIGTGTYTTMAQVAAETLGVPVEHVRAELGDSDMPKAPVSGGSQSSASVLPAVQAAAQKLRQKILSLAHGRNAPGPLQGVRVVDLDLVDGVVSLKTDRDKRASLVELMKSLDRDAIEATETSKPGKEEETHSAHSFGAHFIEVSVDPDLGEVRIRRCVGAFAGGRIINAKTAHSQYIGGIVYGLGMALTEETEVDPNTGRIANANIAEYLVPVHADVPDITVLQIPEKDTVFNSLGIKGIGELPMVGAAAAVANAVYHATGQRIRDLPIRPDKLIRV
ncbi:MAG TPA: xanthine dehydrogenase family protein molybdopterin-binding subunit [Stellaceae bacterium]|jgi:xanthine dehydrogenase YagR molybdenum-binding subunit|nr:xanthine dehydrogenase family protein molybdopterin-binding subunit [Stellaceae bacterium]